MRETFIRALALLLLVLLSSSLLGCSGEQPTFFDANDEKSELLLIISGRSHGRIARRYELPGRFGHDRRRLLQGSILSSNKMSSNSTAFFWNQESFNFWEAESLCASLGGSLLSRSTLSSPSLASSLDPSIRYWTGLFNAAQNSSSWVFLNQAPYLAAETDWAPQQPLTGNDAWCSYISWSSGEWLWSTDSCSVPHAPLCELNQVLPLSGPFCLANYDLSMGTVYASSALDPTLSAADQAKSCVQQCQEESRCDSCTLSLSSGCQLSTGRPLVNTTSSIPPDAFGALSYSSDISLSCFKYALDFSTSGLVAATSLIGSATPPLKCISDYQVNVDIISVLSTCSLSSCVNSCWEKSSCNAVIHTSTGRCKCILGSNALYGSEAALGATPNIGMTTCLTSDSAWLQLGSIFNPTSVDIIPPSSLPSSSSNGPLDSPTTVFTFHPEPLMWRDAESACASDASRIQMKLQGVVGSASGHLASAVSDSDLQQLISIIEQQPPVFRSPAPSTLSDFYGFWIGLTGPSSSISSALSAPPGSFTLTPSLDDPSVLLRWTDGSSASSGPGARVLQEGWGFGFNGRPFSVDSRGSLGPNLCLLLSNSSSLQSPGFVSAASCSWTLPFVCKTILPPATLDNIPSTSSSPPSPSLVPLPVPPQFIQPPPNLTLTPTSALGPIWYPPLSSTKVSADQAGSSCTAWGGSLVTILNEGLEQLLGSSLDPKSSPYWLGLETSSSLWSWSSLTSSASSSALASYSAWCIPQAFILSKRLGGLGELLPSGYGRGAGSNATGAASASGGSNATSLALQLASSSSSTEPLCGLFSFSQSRCSRGYGWDIVPCSEPQPSFLCSLPPNGLPNGNMHCVESYRLGGTILSVLHLGANANLSSRASKTSQDLIKIQATYCADACRVDGACHGFSLSPQGNCTLVSRGLSSSSSSSSSLPAQDTFDPTIALSCLKHALMWDLLGGAVSVQKGVAANPSLGYRCLDDQSVTLTLLGVSPVHRCLLSDCTALCFANYQCSVAVYDRTSCSCSLGYLPLDGSSGVTGHFPGRTTCMFAAERAFVRLGLLKGSAYIIKPSNESGASDIIWGGAGSGGSGSGTTLITLAPSPAPANYSSPSPPPPRPQPSPRPSTPTANTTGFSLNSTSSTNISLVTNVSSSTTDTSSSTTNTSSSTTNSTSSDVVSGSGRDSSTLPTLSDQPIVVTETFHQGNNSPSPPPIVSVAVPAAIGSLFGVIAIVFAALLVHRHRSRSLNGSPSGINGQIAPAGEKPQTLKGLGARLKKCCLSSDSLGDKSTSDDRELQFDSLDHSVKGEGRERPEVEGEEVDEGSLTLTLEGPVGSPSPPPHVAIPTTPPYGGGATRAQGGSMSPSSPHPPTPPSSSSSVTFEACLDLAASIIKRLEPSQPSQLSTRFKKVVRGVKSLIPLLEKLSPLTSPTASPDPRPATQQEASAGPSAGPSGPSSSLALVLKHYRGPNGELLKGSSERQLALQVVGDCHATLMACHAWTLDLDLDLASHATPLPGHVSRGYHLLGDRLSAAFSDLMYLALAFNINVEHREGEEEVMQGQGTQVAGGSSVEASPPPGPSSDQPPAVMVEESGPGGDPDSSLPSSLIALHRSIADLAIGSLFCGKYQTRGRPTLKGTGQSSYVSLPARMSLNAPPPPAPLEHPSQSEEGEKEATRASLKVEIRFYDNEHVVQSETRRVLLNGLVVVEAITGLHGLPPALVVERR